MHIGHLIKFGLRNTQYALSLSGKSALFYHHKIEVMKNKPVAKMPKPKPMQLSS